jgi:hypothetical protein
MVDIFTPTTYLSLKNQYLGCAKAKIANLLGQDFSQKKAGMNNTFKPALTFQYRKKN